MSPDASRSALALLVLPALAFTPAAGPALASPQEVGEISEEDFEERKLPKDPVYSPYAGRDYPDRVFFGDTHYHTKLSPDAGLLGNTLSVSDGYRVARGEKVISSTGQPFQLIRPLDFLAITDHAEYIGLAPMIRDANPVLLSDPHGKWLYENFSAGDEGAMKAFQSILTDATKGENRLGESEMVPTIWREFVETADEYNEPGRFTAMTGFEWTSTPDGRNLHRVIVFADGADKTSQVLPYSLFDSMDPEDLWKYLADYERKTGGRAIATPHNANLSNGLMFSEKRFNGEKMDRAYAETRARWERLHEMSQMKGDEETHPFLSPEDEFADFENWDVANITGREKKEDSMLQYEYARSALKLGLKLGKELGANPFKHGMSAATDTHTALPSSREENYFGKMAKTEPSPDRHDGDVIPADDPALRITTAQEGASGLLAVWARENTRAEIFDGMSRKETYATTGTRIRVRVFAGWNFGKDDLDAADFAATGYGGGVPMGGDLTKAPSGKAPRFLIRALRDPDWANLDRVQVIKGWLDAQGKTQERIYDVAVTDGRKIGSDGRCKTPVGSTVDVEKATFTNRIGEATLSAYWTDPDFDPKESAFYYVRVLEIPTPRWTTYDAAFFGIERPKNVPATLQDRAYTSPIWYTP
ncbi:MAG: DUF3604 domain-containing protein [Myxococcota bacterium]|nr:DUF3604 domain-containing protein [Myxococcota bacterium]